MAVKKKSKIIEKEEDKNTELIIVESTVKAEVFLSIEEFIGSIHSMTEVEKYCVTGNHKTDDLRTKEDWIAITGLK